MTAAPHPDHRETLEGSRMTEKAQPDFFELVSDPARLQAVAAALKETKATAGYAYLMSLIQRGADAASRLAIRTAGKECSLEYASALIAVSDSISAHVEAVIKNAEDAAKNEQAADGEISRMSFGGGSPAI